MKKQGAMRHFLILLLYVAFILSCGDGINRYDTSEVVTRDDITYLFSTMEPVTGIVSDEYSTGQLWHECSYLNGKKHGKEQMWFQNGNLSFLNNYVLGEYSGISAQYYENGQIKKRYYWMEHSYQEPDCWEENGNKIDCE